MICCSHNLFLECALHTAFYRPECHSHEILHVSCFLGMLDASLRPRLPSQSGCYETTFGADMQSRECVCKLPSYALYVLCGIGATALHPSDDERDLYALRVTFMCIAPITKT